ncbi:decarboxylating 6-phosphogluconate dehydrogenase [Acidobacteriia bacterium AH_259_A11_L15]|nr:decarboxylating 6-phosphogluconate dehydrogenase [Acidobacteriia bacterium AH_259_A11_L15]
MQLGMVGLGRMGGNMAERLLKGGHQVVGYTRDKEGVKRAVEKGAVGAYSLPELVEQLKPPRIVWLMIPAGNPVDESMQTLEPLLKKGDVIIDGGNSNYKDTIRRAAALKEKGFHFVDVGTSGGIWGLKEGYCMMIGGDGQVVKNLTPIFQTLAPAPDKGWGHVGPSGAGHFVKMVHNGIEYGLMQAYAEGFALMRSKAELSLDMRQIAEIWRYGSVVRSWLLDLTARALAKNPSLEGIAPHVSDSGEGRWTVVEAIELGCAIPVITLALEQRFRSRDTEPFGDKLLAVMREQFGGHAVKRTT